MAVIVATDMHCMYESSKPMVLSRLLTVTVPNRARHLFEYLEVEKRMASAARSPDECRIYHVYNRVGGGSRELSDEELTVNWSPRAPVGG